MENCPRSCPSRVLSPSELVKADGEEDSLPSESIQNILIWNKSISKPLKLTAYDVAVYDDEHHCFQEYQKRNNELQFQLQNGKKFATHWFSLHCYLTPAMCSLPFSSAFIAFFVAITLLFPRSRFPSNGSESARKTGCDFCGDAIDPIDSICAVFKRSILRSTSYLTV